MSTKHRRDARPEETHQNSVETARKGGLVSTFHTAQKALRHLAEIKDVVRDGTRYAAEHVSIPQALEWLLDNWYIAEREGKGAADDIRRLGRLPRCGDGKTLFVLYAAHEYLDRQNDAVDADSLEAFLDDFQTETILSEAELAAMIPAVRLALIERLAEEAAGLLRALGGGVAQSLTELAGTFSRIFTSLRFLSGFDSSDLLERVGRVEHLMRQDPAGVYPEMDEATRHDYRRTLARLAEKHGMSEHEAAEKILALARESGEHIGNYLYVKPLGKEIKTPRGGLYIASIVLTSLALSILAALLLRHPVYLVALFFPLSSLVKSAADYVVLKFCPIRRVPRLALEGGVPEEGRALCVISLLLTSEDEAKRAAALLEEYALANRDAGKNVSYGLLVDLPDSLEAETDADRARLAHAAREIAELNARHGGGFFLFYRAKTYSRSSRCYTPWERKRGAILEMCRHLRGKSSRIVCLTGDVKALHGTRYLITLDGDTRLCAGTARELIGAAMHPLCRAAVDEKRRVVVSGCGIIQPRVTVDLTASNQTAFTRVFAGLGGIDPYGATVGDVYQNLAGAGSFTGKGLIDVDAYLECLDGRFPQELVLSHDLLEGAYLRCAFAGDIEVTDGFPAKVTSYFDRMHRWTRGDWQSAPWLFPVVKDESGRLVPNPLSALDKWKIFDNLRRSLVPVATFILLVAAIITGARAPVWAAVAAFGAQIARLAVLSASSLLRGRRARARYHSTVVSGVRAALAQSALQFLFLPYEAWICLSAALTALWRMLISRRNLLKWVTAADAERRAQGGAADAFVKMSPALIPCAMAAALSPHIAGTILALVWFISPFVAARISRKPRPGTEALRAEDRRFLLRCAGDIWRFFETFLTTADHFLPPDNYQEQPAVGIAHRTSPTNIGLALLSCLAAADLGLCRKEKALSLIAQTLTTVERLPKWNGHLYNWYDTLTLTVLPPAYVSSVDSGNFAGCLIALREGLLEYGAADLAERANALLKAMSFEPLYDKKRRLFYIGIDADKNAPTQGWYDLLASEARQTSYIAVARGEVPKKHWRSLGRALVEKDGYRGMASWTGTMFEYLMPEILLPCYPNSLIYESLKFCLYIQKKQAKSKPWGMSESAFYAYDHTLSYRYKAHGAATLALKRGMERDTVVSPYSTFLALPIEPRAAVRNLKYLQKLGAEGRYGFYEALDFTPERLPEDKPYEIVRTYMAHHLGMSLLSIANALKGGVIQKRFMRDKLMAAFAELLQEKLPVGGVVLRPSPRDVPEKPLRASADRWRYASSTPDYSHPAFTLLGNGAYHVAISETGLNRSVWNGLEIMQCGTEPFSMQAGLTFYLRVGEDIIPLQCAPVFSETVHYSAELSGSCCRLMAQSGPISSVVTATVPKDETGELRTVEITSRVSCEAELVCYGEPVLARGDDFASHPAFSKLSLQSAVVDGAVVFRRRPRARGQGYALAAAVSCPYTFDTSREKALGRGGFHALPSALSRPAGGSAGSVLDPCLLLRVPLRLEAGKTERVRFALTVSQEPDAAAWSALRLVGEPERAPASHLDVIAEELSLSHEDIARAMALVPYLLLQPLAREIPQECMDALALGQSGLWVFGVSGDLPIVACVVEDEEALNEAASMLAMHRLLRENGVAFDLVFVLKDGGEYRSTLREGIVSRLRRQEYEYILGARGGVHTVDAAADNVRLLLAAAVKVIRTRSDFAREGAVTVRPALGERFFPPVQRRELEYGYDEENSFVFTVSGKLPPNAWSHVLANERFGFVATDAGTGHLWHINARENKINQWRNDSLLTLGTETLSAFISGRPVSLFAAEDGFTCRVTYGFGWAEWRKTIGDVQFTTTAFVPPDRAARVLMIEASEGSLADIEYYTDLVLAPDARDAVYTETREEGGVISAQNRYNRAFDGSVFRLTASQPYDEFTCSQLSYKTGRLDGRTGAGFLPCAAARWRGVQTLVIVTGCEDADVLRALAQPASAASALEDTKRYWKDLTGKLTVSTQYEELDRYINGWAVYQALACRIFGRTSLYQSGGAYGFRDQLQDICAVLDEAPDVARAHILRAAAHQFEEGDVQHWWHPAISGGPDKGVRTRCSDDLLWLPFALCQYVEKTGDRSILDETVPYLTSPVLGEGEHERYEQPQISEKSASVLQHAVDAALLVIRRGTGRNGLLLIGTGDWNDGLNLVGARGDGESVWLTWFAVIVFRRLAALCQERGMPGVAATLLEKAEEYFTAAENAWDGAWYKRGYYDNGAPLGSCTSDECQIDSIAQSFAVFAGADREKARTALISSVKRLYDPSSRVVRLFDPPFSHGGSVPGYIKGYSPGFRENGGQYTHGAIWLAMALLRAGMKREGFEITRALSPLGRLLEVYRTEPYVIAADVYWAQGHVGRGGWTWYTGAAGWYKRLVVEELLGLAVINGALHIRPSLPPGFGGYTARWRHGGKTYDITVRDNGTVEVTCGGAPADDGSVVVYKASPVKALGEN
ncbi:MAG: hypothetical protein GX189_05910 [Clostridiales bacterium]|nr:hypothetical protein [Clostridiales bacterium]